MIANENKTLKEQVKTLLEKGKHDDELIEALMKKQNQLKELVETLGRQNEDLNRQMELQSKDVLAYYASFKLKLKLKIQLF